MTPNAESPSYDEITQKGRADVPLTMAQLRKNSDNVYMSNRKSMNREHTSTPPEERKPPPLDSGATENFMSLTVARWLKLPFKRLLRTPLLNIDDDEQNGFPSILRNLQYRQHQPLICVLLTDLDTTE